jgi:bifunctional non-homologous end joining protein LigD
MLATPGSLPAGPGWAYEMKWDGIRAVTYASGRTVRIRSRNDREITASFPELAGLVAAFGLDRLVLDGEIVAMGDTGAPSFGLLQNRMHVRSPTQSLIRNVPVRLIAFDVLHLGPDSTLTWPYRSRRELLAQLLAGLPPTEMVSVPPHFTEDGPAAEQVSAELGLEGVVAKQLASVYRPGVRSKAWIKVPRFEEVDVVVGGWTPGSGRRGGRIGSLLAGVRRDGALVFAGAVGTGFTDTELARLRGLLDPLRADSSPFDSPVPAEYVRDARWVRPSLEGHVRIRNWTADGLFRHPSWRGLRQDG